MTKKSVVVDTNLLLDDPKIIFKLANTHEKIIVPITVLKELDKHKFNPNLSYSARSAIYEIINFKDKFSDKLDITLNEKITEDDNDSKIIMSAIENKAELATKDIYMSVIAEANGIDSKLYNVVTNGFFDPYYFINASEFFDAFKLEQIYVNGEKAKENYYDFVIELINAWSERYFDPETWSFVFISSTKSGSVDYIYANNPLKHELIRIDNKPNYRIIDAGGATVKALDIYQVCAIYALKTAPNTLITGKWGSGKTLLATAHALGNNNRKTFIIRPPIGINNKFNMGFLPGDIHDKLSDYHSGFLSALYYLFANTKNQQEGGVEYDYVKDNLFSQSFEIMPLPALQGMSLLENDILIVDETQLLDIDHISMILSRINEGSKLILLGDLAQTYNVIRPSESGLLKLRRILPHRYMAHVDLENSYRSELVELADKLQDKTIT